MKLLFSLAAFLTLTLTAPAKSGWGPSGCAAQELVSSHVIVRPAPIQKDPAFQKHEWRRWNETQHGLYRDGVCIGAYDTVEHCYKTWTNGVWGDQCSKPPIDPPGSGYENMPLQEWQIKGVQANMIGKRGIHYSYCGRQVDPDQCLQAIEGKLIDDSGKGWFVAWSKDSKKREEMLQAWAKLPKEFTDRFKVWAAPPEHFLNQDRWANKPRFEMHGDGFLLLNADGEVLCRHPHTAEQVYRGPEDVQGLLKIDPKYDAKLDPGLPGASKPFQWEDATPALAVGGILLGLIIFRRLAK